MHKLLTVLHQNIESRASVLCYCLQRPRLCVIHIASRMWGLEISLGTPATIHFLTTSDWNLIIWTVNEDFYKHNNKARGHPSKRPVKKGEEGVCEPKWTTMDGVGGKRIGHQPDVNKQNVVAFWSPFWSLHRNPTPPPIHRRPDNVRQGRGYLKSQFSLGRLWWITPNCNSINLGPKQIGTSVGNFFHRPYIWTADWHMCRHSFFDEEAVSVSTTSNLIAVIG